MKALFLAFSLLLPLSASSVFSQSISAQVRSSIVVGANVSSDSRPRIVGSAAMPATSGSGSISAVSLERQVFAKINEKRSSMGLEPLVWNDQIEEIARHHSEKMAAYNFFSHRDAEGKMVSDRADDAGLTKWRSIGENIAFSRGYTDPVGKTVELWLNSPDHRRNMLAENWRESAIGVAIAKDGSMYVTQVFLQRK